MYGQVQRVSNIASQAADDKTLCENSIKCHIYSFMQLHFSKYPRSRGSNCPRAIVNKVKNKKTCCKDTCSHDHVVEIRTTRPTTLLGHG